MFQKIRSNFASGFVTGIFSIPEGMAYAKLAGVDPAYGLYSAIAPTIAASLSTSTVLMISTLTSAIAISTESVMHVSGLKEHYESTVILSTLTFLMGLFMLILGLLRMGKIVNFVSNSVMTGFVMGASLLIIIGELGDLVGIKTSGSNKLMKGWDWISHFNQWDLATSVVGIGSLLLMLLLQKIQKTKEAASVITLLAGTLFVSLSSFETVETVGDIAHISSGFPRLSLPNPELMPKLAFGSVLVALVALTQGAGIASAVPNPSGERSDSSKDFVGQGLGNLFGSFFQSMGTGGSLSRTAISTGSGATSRLSGIFAGLWVLLLVFFAGRYAEKVPLSVIAGILCVVAARIILNRLDDVTLILRSSIHSTLLLLITFGSALLIPLQWTIFLGAGLSFFYYLYTSGTEIRLYQLLRNKNGFLEEKKLPETLPSNAIITIGMEGDDFFAEVPLLEQKLPSLKGTANSVIIWRMRRMTETPTTFLKWLKEFTTALQSKGCTLVLAGVEPEVMQELILSGISELIGKENLFPSEPGLQESLSKAEKRAQNVIQNASY